MMMTGMGFVLKIGQIYSEIHHSLMMVMTDEKGSCFI